MSRIVWLASYPKSGNTWLRAFLANLQSAESKAANINAIDLGGLSSNRCGADDALGVESSDLTWEEIDGYRPALYRTIARGGHEVLFIKAHDAYTFNSSGEPLIPADVKSVAVYLVRNPLDVAVSYAHHANKTIDETIDRMSREGASLAWHRDRLDLQLPQTLMSWSRHVLSWIDQREIPVRVMRYEDMSRQPVEEFSETLRFIGLNVDPERVSRAAEFSSFETLRRQELEHGFREKPWGATSFFRSGRVGGWRDTLTDVQIARLIRDHGAVMRRLGYLEEEGFPV